MGHITRLVDFTQLKILNVEGNDNAFKNADAVENLMRVLRQRTSLEECTTELDFIGFPDYDDIVDNSMARNTRLRHAKELLSPRQPRTGWPIGSKSGIWYEAFAKMGRRDDNAGASAIFDILQKRPMLVEKRLRRPPESNGKVARSGSPTSSSNNSEKGRKRARSS
jgi:hypothetical protein